MASDKIKIYHKLAIDLFTDNILLIICCAKFLMEGMYLMPELTINYREEARALLKADAEKILRLIKVQIDNLTMPQCPLYEEVLDTQMFGLSREIDFAIRLNLIKESEGKALLENLEKELNILHEKAQKSS